MPVSSTSTLLVLLTKVCSPPKDQALNVSSPKNQALNMSGRGFSSSKQRFHFATSTLKKVPMDVTVEESIQSLFVDGFAPIHMLQWSLLVVRGCEMKSRLCGINFNRSRRIHKLWTGAMLQDQRAVNVARGHSALLVASHSFLFLSQALSTKKFDSNDPCWDPFTRSA